jgi:hypothetical protein
MGGGGDVTPIVKLSFAVWILWLSLLLFLKGVAERKKLSASQPPANNRYDY